MWLNNHPYEACFAKTSEAISEFHPQVIGLQMMTANRVSTYKLLEYIHSRYPEIFLVVGGIHATMMHMQLIAKYPFLIVVIGEGEITFSELVARLPGERSELSGIKGITYHLNGEIITTRPRELLENLDSLPFPKHEAFFDSQRDYGCIITSRGCPSACSFCCLKVITKRRVRMRGIANIMEEIELLIKKFPQMRTLFIHDDTFLLDNKRAIAFCDEIVKRGIKLDFICSARLKPLSAELVSKLEQANFKQVLFGLESGDEKVLAKCHKGVTPQDAINAFQLFAHSPIHLHAFLIVGLPGENRETILNTARLVKKLQKIKYVHYTNLALLTVYPGSEVCEIAKKGGVLNDDFWFSDKPTPLFTLENDLGQLFKLQETLLTHIALNRFFTPAGFLAQIEMLPYIIAATALWPKLFVSFIARNLREFLPSKTYNAVRTLYRALR